MKRTNTVRERVEAAIRMRRHASPALPVSIAAVCRDAAVNRANLYAHYPDLIQYIRSTWPTRQTHHEPRGHLKVPAQRQPSVDKALLYLCLELRAEVEALRKRADYGLPLADKLRAKR